MKLGSQLELEPVMSRTSGAAGRKGTARACMPPCVVPRGKSRQPSASKKPKTKGQIMVVVVVVVMMMRWGVQRGEGVDSIIMQVRPGEEEKPVPNAPSPCRD